MEEEILKEIEEKENNKHEESRYFIFSNLFASRRVR